MVAIIPWTSFCQHQAQLRHVSEDGGGNGGGGDGGGGGGDDGGGDDGGVRRWTICPVVVY